MPSVAFGMDSFELTSSAGVPSRLVDQARVDARAVGYAQGWSQGLREAAESQAAAVVNTRAAADRQAADRLAGLDAVLASVRAAADRLDATAVELTDAIADQILVAAVELATALLGQELRDPVTTARAALARALDAAPADAPIAIRLSPADHATLTAEGGPALVAGLNRTGRPIELEADPSLTPGDALARTGATSIDARLSEAVRRLREYPAA